MSASLRLVTLTEKEYVQVVRAAVEAGRTGGRIHDDVHLRCAQKKQCDRIYTFYLDDPAPSRPPT